MQARHKRRFGEKWKRASVDWVSVKLVELPCMGGYCIAFSFFGKNQFFWNFSRTWIVLYMSEEWRPYPVRGRRVQVPDTRPAKFLQNPACRYAKMSFVTVTL